METFTRTFDRGTGADRRLGRENADDLRTAAKAAALREFRAAELADLQRRLADRLAVDPKRRTVATLRLELAVTEAETALADLRGVRAGTDRGGRERRG